MKYYKDVNGVVYAYELDGSQDHIIPEGHVGITKDDADSIINATTVAEFENLDHTVKRAQSYPPITDFLDAWVKDNQEALEEYRQKCLEVKARYPKPTGA